jgi:hypothetical protein
MIETGVDVLLALLHARGATGQENEPILGITRLQKLLFLLWKEGNFYKAVPDLYNFKAYDFGPCMDDLYDDLEFTQTIGLVTIVESTDVSEFDNDNDDEATFMDSHGLRIPKQRIRRDYSITESGIEASKELFSDLSAQDVEAIENIKRRFNKMPILDLLRYVYNKYPKFAERSVLTIAYAAKLGWVPRPETT